MRAFNSPLSCRINSECILDRVSPQSAMFLGGPIYTDLPEIHAVMGNLTLQWKWVMIRFVGGNIDQATEQMLFNSAEIHLKSEKCISNMLKYIVQIQIYLFGISNTNTNTNNCVFEYKYKYVFEPSPDTKQDKACVQRDWMSTRQTLKFPKVVKWLKIALKSLFMVRQNCHNWL